MDDDLARAIALSLQEQTQKSQEDRDLERALELSRKMSQPTTMQPSSSSFVNRKRKAESVEILSSDEEDIDPDLKMAIELSKTLNGQSNTKHDYDEIKHHVDEDRELALRLQK